MPSWPTAAATPTSAWWTGCWPPRIWRADGIFWLDLVRYADTTGYHSDNHVDICLFRDYVIRAFNTNMPFDRFTIEQLAGDLVPAQPTRRGRLRLQPPAPDHTGGRRPGQGVPRQVFGRPRPQRLDGLDGRDARAAPSATTTSTTRTRRVISTASPPSSPTSRRPRSACRRRPSSRRLRRPRPCAGSRRRASLVESLNRATPELEHDQQVWEETLRTHGPNTEQTSSNVPRAILDIVKLDPSRRTEARESCSPITTGPAPPRAGSPGHQGDPERPEHSTGRHHTAWSRSPSPGDAGLASRQLAGRLRAGGHARRAGVPAASGRERAAARRGSTWPDGWSRARTRSSPGCWSTGSGSWLSARDRGDARRLRLAGAWPTHPELLDWLAAEFVDSGWDVKQMLRLIVMSGAYRQSSLARASRSPARPGQPLAGPAEPLPARRRVGPRQRPGGQRAACPTRSAGRASSRTSPPATGRTSISPRAQYDADHGENQYRRGLYTYWQRTFLHPSLLAFDASTREECVVQRARSNTPLQALVLLNDPTYVEAARVLAARVLREAGTDPTLAAFRPFGWPAAARPVRQEREVLQALSAQARQPNIRSDPAAARELLGVGDTPAPTAPASTLPSWRPGPP